VRKVRRQQVLEAQVARRSKGEPIPTAAITHSG
jgi:hypothetical protein